MKFNLRKRAEYIILRHSSTLVPSGPALLAMTNLGSSGGYGTIFKINTNGSDCQVSHNFAGGNNWQKSFSLLILAGPTLYGVTSDEAAAADGTNFKINRGLEPPSACNQLEEMKWNLK